MAAHWECRCLERGAELRHGTANNLQRAYGAGSDGHVSEGHATKPQAKHFGEKLRFNAFAPPHVLNKLLCELRNRKM